MRTGSRVFPRWRRVSYSAGGLVSGRPPICVARIRLPAPRRAVNRLGTENRTEQHYGAASLYQRAKATVPATMPLQTRAFAMQKSDALRSLVVDPIAAP